MLDGNDNGNDWGLGVKAPFNIGVVKGSFRLEYNYSDNELSALRVLWHPLSVLHEAYENGACYERCCKVPEPVKAKRNASAGSNVRCAREKRNAI